MIIKLHDDEAGNLALPGVEEGQVGLDFVKRSHAEQAGAVADFQELLKCCSGCGYVLGGWF